MPRLKGTILENFWKRVSPEPNSGCWLWTGYVSIYGYGKFYVRAPQAHRFSYELHKGPIPEGLELDHLCRVRCCVNPQHLEAVTGDENKRRAREANPRNTHCKYGHPYTPENTRIHAGRPTIRYCITCKNEYNRGYWITVRKPHGDKPKRQWNCANT